MNLSYHNYNVEDFSQDESFRTWVLNPNNESELFWTNWLAQNPDCAATVNSARAFLLTLHEQDIILTDNELTLITEKIIKGRTVKISIWENPIFRIAASIALISVIAFLGIKYYTDKQQLTLLEKLSDNLSVNYIETENSESIPKEISLTDGSVIMLYPKSKIRYPKEFPTQIREVYLVGQAFFDIAKNPKQPFWVYTNYISTQVLGTSFMVKAFDNEKDIKVEVRTGKVSVYSRKDIEKAKTQKNSTPMGIILTPNQAIEYSVADARLMKSLSKRPEILTTESLPNFVFDEAPIAEVFSTLEKAYGIQIIYDEKVMEKCYLTASLTDESLFEKLNLICKITRSNYKVIDAQIVIQSDGC